MQMLPQQRWNASVVKGETPALPSLPFFLPRLVDRYLQQNNGRRNRELVGDRVSGCPGLMPCLMCMHMHVHMRNLSLVPGKGEIRIQKEFCIILLVSYPRRWFIRCLSTNLQTEMLLIVQAASPASLYALRPSRSVFVTIVPKEKVRRQSLNQNTPYINPGN